MATDQSIEAQLYEAVQPAARDLLEARESVLDVLADGRSHHESAFVGRILTTRSIPVEQPREQIEVSKNRDGTTTPIDRDHPAIVRKRTKAAVREALAELTAIGVVVMVQGDSYRETTDSVQVHVVMGSGSSTGGKSYTSRLPVFGESSHRWRLLRPAAHHRHQLARDSLDDGLDDVLGPRGVEVLREAIACFHQGRFLAAADLLAAASEAAWFVVAAAAHGSDRKLDEHVASGENAADVIHRTEQVLSSRRALTAQTLRDVRAQAARFRDIRNYGLHPIGLPDADREDAFTEHGCAALFMSARRYFRHLDDARLFLQPASDSPTP